MNSTKLKFLVVVQDLRISGTSEGIVSRSFLARLRQVFPLACIDVVYLRNHHNNDELQLIDVNKIEDSFISSHIPWWILWGNKFWWRATGISLKDNYRISRYRKHLKKIDFKNYDHIFFRSSGQDFELLRALKNLPVLKEAILNFHDPYPIFWDNGAKKQPSRLEYMKFKEMWEIVMKSRACMSPSLMLSQDLENLYGSKKTFYLLPHQFVSDVFKKADPNNIRNREKKVVLSYHGAVQLGRNIDILISAYIELMEEHPRFLEETELVLRLRGAHTRRLKEKFQHPNVVFANPVDFASSFLEQKKETDILIVLENCSTHSNILVGKAPLLAYLQKPVLSLSPARSEMKRILTDNMYYAGCDDKNDIKDKLSTLIEDRFVQLTKHHPFGIYFELLNFEKYLARILAT